MGIKSYIKNSLLEAKHRKLFARDPRAHDIYVVEFPKSGITWLCTLLANMALRESGSLREVTFYNVQNLIPDVHMCKAQNIGESMLPTIGQRLIKSHSYHNPLYQNCIYLVRHPVSVMNSYYRYLNMHPDYQISEKTILSDRRQGVPAWKRHVNGWLRSTDQSRRLHLIRYEDLVSDTVGQLQNLTKNLGWPITQESIDAAVSRSLPGEMKDSENLYKKHNPRYYLNFVKSGSVDLKETSKELIRHECQKELELLGY